MVGSVAITDSLVQKNLIPGSSGDHVTYTLNQLKPSATFDTFYIDHNTGSLVVARELDRESCSEYVLEVFAVDTSTTDNHYSSAMTVRVDVDDVNDNAPKWLQDPVVITLPEDTPVGKAVHNFTAVDADIGNNGDLRYTLVMQSPGRVFDIDAISGTLKLTKELDFELLKEYILVVAVTDQSLNASERLTTTVTARVLVTDTNDNAPR